MSSVLLTMIKIFSMRYDMSLAYLVRPGGNNMHVMLMSPFTELPTQNQCIQHSNTSMLLKSGLKKFTMHSKTTHSRSQLHHQATTVYFPITNAQIYIEKSLEKNNRKCQHQTGNSVTHHILLNSEIHKHFQIISQ